MAVGDGIAFERAMGDLMTQVNPDNVLAVHRVFKDQAESLKLELQRMATDTTVGLCGADPVSLDAANSFNSKIGELLAVHWRHWEELEAVAERLAATARTYGKTEDQISGSFSGTPAR